MALKAGRVGVNPKGVNKEGMPILDPSVMHAAITAAVNHLAGMITVTAKTGNPVSITDAIGGAAQGMKITLSPKQSGSGAPSLENVRLITGHSGVTVARTAGGSTVNFTVAFTDPATVYGGVLDMNTGVIRITYKMLSVADFDTHSSATSAGGLYWVDCDNKGAKANGNVLSNVLPTKSSSEGSSSTTPCVITTSIDRVRVYVSESTLEAFQSTYSDLQVCVELAAPVIVQVPADIVELLNGINTLASGDGTSMNISYLAITENPVTPTRSLPAPDQRSVKSVEEVKEEVPVEEPVTVKKSTKKSTK